MSSPLIPVSDCVPRGQLVSVNTAAKRKELSTKTIRRRIRDGSLRAYKAVGTRAVRVDTADLDAMFVVYGGAE
jgi:excisionase family DNA binding protein